MFLGTPFEPSNKAGWGKIGLKFLKAFGAERNRKLEELEEKSTTLSVISDNFYKLIWQRKDFNYPLKVTCFFEVYPTDVGTTKIGNIVEKSWPHFEGWNLYLLMQTIVGYVSFKTKIRKDIRRYLKLSDNGLQI